MNAGKLVQASCRGWAQYRMRTTILAFASEFTLPLIKASHEPGLSSNERPGN